MREQIARIVKQGRTGVKITSNGIAYFIEYPLSEEEQANQLLALIKAKIEKVENPTKKLMVRRGESAFRNRYQERKYQIFEQARQAILALFKEKGDE